MATITANTTIISGQSTAANGVTDGTTAWIRATRRASDGRIQYFKASGAIANPVAADFTQLGADVLTTAGAIFDGNAVVELGSLNQGSASPMFGKLYRAQIRNGLDGTVVFDSDLTSKTFGVNSFTESSANAATVTINGTLAQAGDGRVSLVSSTPGTAATITRSSGTVYSDYLVIQDSTATKASWFAGSHSVNVSNNTGWIFSGVPAAQPANFMPFFRGGK